MAITNAEVTLLNNMNPAAQRSALGTELQTTQNTVASVVRGTHTVSAAEESAGTLDIATGLTTVAGFIVQVYRADILLTAYDVSEATGTLTIATNGSDYVVTEDDVINYIVF